MQRVVLTSSIRAVFGFGSEKPADYLYTEGDWNTSSTLENNQAYALSKTLAEVRAACVRRATDGRTDGMVEAWGTRSWLTRRPHPPAYPRLSVCL